MNLKQKLLDAIDHEGMKKALEHATLEEKKIGAVIESIITILVQQREALEHYTHYDNETVRHMDTEFMKPERLAVIKPLNRLGKGDAPEGTHPSQVHQNLLFTFGPKERPGKIARDALAATDEALKGLGIEV